jgi:hypothetical protein
MQSRTLDEDLHHSTALCQTSSITALPSARHLRPQLCHLSNIIDHGIVIYDLLNIIDHSIVICQHHNLDSDPARNDENLYALGSIAGHNVAIVCLPDSQLSGVLPLIPFGTVT